MSVKICAGAASADWTPSHSCHLAGYPHVDRHSLGTHDPLLATALYMDDGTNAVMLIAIDILFVTHAMVRQIRERLTRKHALNLSPDHILIAATHTHSGPAVVEAYPNPQRPSPPTVEPAILERCMDAAVQVACDAHAARVDAELACVVGDASGVGTNRRRPDGPNNPAAPLLIARRIDDHLPIAAMGICHMHPTVLHEDSKLFSGDFPAYARRYLQTHWLGEQTPMLYFTGAAGNQSPRHVTRANTFDEAQRLGEMLGRRWLDAIEARELPWQTSWPIDCRTTTVTLPPRRLPTLSEATQKMAAALEQLNTWREQGAPRAKIRTAEVDWFGTERTVTAVKAAAAGLVDQAVAERSPTEIQLMTIGPWSFVAWPGEVFVEFALAVRALHPEAHVITYANGENLGYLVTAEAVAQGGYEASHALFASPESGDTLVLATLEQLEANAQQPSAQTKPAGR